MSKIKVAHIIGRLDIGGAEKLLLDLGRKIDKNRFEIKVVSLGGEGVMLKAFEAADVPVTVIEKKFVGDFRVLKALSTWLIKERPDIVHTHLFGGDFWGGLAARKAGIKKIISTKHDILNEGFWRNHIGRIMRRRFDFVVAISEATKKNLVEIEKLNKNKIRVIYNGIDMAKYYVPGAEILTDDEVVFGTVGRLVGEKGQAYFIKALKFLKQRSWKAVLVGGGPEEKKLKALVKKLKLNDKVHFVGEVNDVRSHVAEFDVFVLPSLTEGLSLALIESAAAGKYVVASRVGGVPEIVRDKSWGTLYNPHSLSELVTSLNWVFDHRSEAKRAALRLQNFVVETFDINKIIDRYEQVYEDIVDK
ncbi:TPA: hypothetical protein DF272_05665 [Candidatus Falkowbacteria bacterium]|nr:hypothetical protein [Candidatus Falkowbacteria bacterium]